MGRRTRQRQRSTPVPLDPRIDVEKLIRAEVEKLVPSTVQGNRGDRPQVNTRPMTLLEAIGAGTGVNGMPAGFIPFARNPADNNAFGPGHPLLPAPLDAPDPTDGQPLPRVFEYDVSWNLPGNGQREVPWQVLRIASTAVDVIRRCIEYRKRTLRGMKPRWVVSAEAIQAAYESSPDAGRENAEQTLRAQFADKIKELTEFWREPWKQNGLSFGQWINMLMEEHIVLDAVAVYPRKALSGDVLDFQILDGSTIKPLLDVQGARPTSPYAAFQQILYGFPRGEYGASIDPVTGAPKSGYSTAALFYHRENVRANSPYGLSPVEQALIAARLYLKRQGWMLAEYDDGSTPVTWIIPSEDEQQKSGQAFTPQIRRSWEDGVNEELGGSTRRRHRAKVLPPGWQAIQTQSVDERYKPDYDLHLIKLLCGFFNVPITELGFSEAKGIGNSGLHEGMADVSAKVGDRPDAEVIGEMITKLARQFQDCPIEVELTFVAPENGDTLQESQADDLKYKGGVLTLNDLRRKAGLPVFNFPEADMPLLIGIGPTGVTFLEGLHDQQQKMQESQLALTDTQVGAGQAQIQQTQADAQAAAAAPAEDVQKELTAFNRWRRRNPEPKRPFVFKTAEPDDVDALFELDPNAMAFAGWTWVPDLDKGAGWDPGVKRFRDARGKFMKGGMAGDVLDALEDAGHAVTRHPDHPRTAKLSRLHDEHLDTVVNRLQAGRKVRKGEDPRTDALHSAGLLEDSPDRAGELQLSDAGRAHLVARMPEAYAKPEPAAETPMARGRRVQAVAEAAAEVEELINNGADMDTVRHRAGQTAQRNAGNADLDKLTSGLERADNPDEMRKVAREFADAHGLTQVGGDAGSTIAFDPRVHEVVGEHPKAGSAVQVIRPGYTAEDDSPLTRRLYGGTTVPARRAVVVPATDTHDPETPAAPLSTAREMRQRTVDELAQTEAALTDVTDERKRERLEFTRDQLTQQIKDIDAQQARRDAANRDREQSVSAIGAPKSQAPLSTAQKMREAAAARRAERVRKVDTAQAQHHDLTDLAPVTVPEPLPVLDSSSSVQAMTTPIKLTPTREKALAEIHRRAMAGQHAVNAAGQKDIHGRAVDPLMTQGLVRYVPGQNSDLQPWQRKIELTDAGRTRLGGAGSTPAQNALSGSSAPKPLPSSDERQLAIQTASHQRLIDRASALDSEIDLASTDAERARLRRERIALDTQMAALDRQIQAARRRLKRNGKS